MPLILGLESTCDETAAAVVAEGVNVRSNVIASSAELHAVYGGVVPEIASRAQVESLLPVLREACRIAGVGLADVDAISVAHRPGLIGSLLIGLTAAKTLAWSLGKPLVGIDHVHAHLYSVVLRSGGGQGISAEAESSSLTPRPTPAFPAIGLVASGGHTSLYRLSSWTDVQVIGRSIDDAVGEAYDKVAAVLNLGYPGGPVIDRLAAAGDPGAVRFPRAMLGRESLDFSFSGLKTSVLYHVRGRRGRERSADALTDAQRADVCASFQAACIDTLVKKIKRAVKQTAAKSVIVGGGVSANRGLRAALERLPLPVHLPLPPYCTDNAAMSAGLADLLLREGQTSPLDLDALTSSAI